MSRELGHPEQLALSGATIVPVQMSHHSPVRLAIEAVFRQSWLFWGCLLTILALATTVTVVKKKQFQSEMMFLVEASRSNSIISADRASVTPAQDVTEQQINSEIELLQSHDVIGQVVDPGWTMTGKNQAQIEQHESKIGSFKKKLTIESAHKNDVITVIFKGDAPQQSADSLSQLSAAYLTKRKLLTRPPGTSEFFAEQTKRYKDAWDHANQEMIQFQQQNGITSVPDMEEALTQQILTTENQLRTEQAALAEVEQRVQESGRLVAEVPQRQPTQQRMTPNQGAIQQIQSLLVQLKNKRTELLNRYQPTDRLVVENDREIADTTAALQRIEQGRSKEDTTDVNPAWQQVRTGQVQAIIEKRAEESKIASLQGDLTKLHAQLTQIQPLRIRFNELQEQVDQARNNFEIFSQKRDQSNIEDAMDEHKLVNIAVAEAPTLNFHQIAPKPLLYMTLGTVTALFLAGTVVYFAESFRSTIATPRELGLLSRYAVLATLPWDTVTERSSSAALTAGALIDEENSSLINGRGGLIPVMQNMNDAREV